MWKRKRRMKEEEDEEAESKEICRTIWKWAPPAIGE